MSNPDSLLAAMCSHSWAINRAYLRALIERARTYESDYPVEALLETKERQANDPPAYTLVDGVAVIEIHGPIFKQVPWVYGISGCEATGTEDTRLALRDALQNNAVHAIVLDVDSPGGMIDGVQELADDVYAARGQKTVHAIINGMCDSAAYWIASQATTISANETAVAGCIGVFMVLNDWSQAYEDMGIHTIVIKSGPYKGTGVKGAPITDEQLVPFQEEVDDLAAMFVEAIARGRGMDSAQVKDLATGRDWVAPRAAELGLIDQVENSDAAWERASSRDKTATFTQGGPEMGLLNILNRTKAEDVAQEESAPAEDIVEPDEGEEELAPDEEAATVAEVVDEEAEAEPSESEPEEDAVKATEDKFVNFATAVGPELALTALAEGLTIEEAKDRRIEQLTEENERLQAFITNAQLDGAPDPATFPADDKPELPKEQVALHGENMARANANTNLPK